jgi:hypothetical protein
VVVRQLHDRQVGQVAGLLGLLEILFPYVDPVLVGDVQVEQRIVRVADRIQSYSP